ncbi:O-antigen ligase family protein [Phenylobacterium sp.]|uniref:O-antigen ligase family protein n=1 Tax=Phenylobacterium sp. TaxID=1871053 RepID=UPI002DE74FCF|nr:O-antigen ligase family protein [Phenylobacterium sp.]
MTSAWNTTPGDAPRIRRIRGGGEAEPPPNARLRVTPVQEIAHTPHREEGFEIGRTGVDIDGLFAIALLVPMLFVGQLGSLGVAMVAGLVPAYLFLRREGLFKVLMPRSFLFLIPAFALFSVVWSTAPGETLRYAIELAITVVAGLLLSSARNQEAVVRGISLAFLSYVVASIFFGGYVGVGVGMGGEAFSGLSESKNLLADIASTGLVASAVVTMLAVQNRRWLWLAVGLVSIALDLYCAIAARSAGAILGLGMATLAFVGLTPLVYAGKTVRAAVTSMIGLCLVGIGVFYSTIAQAMIDFGASVFDKDPTLTGRTYLWYRAADLIREHPVLGRGFYAFWIQGNIDAEGLWRYFGIDGRGGFTFHNTFVEILVMLGWAGLVLIGATLLTGVVFLIRRFVTRPTLTHVFWMGMLLYELARTPIETVGVAPFYFSTALVFGALGAAFKRSRSRRREREEAQAAQEALNAQAWSTDARGAARPVPVSLRLVRPAPGNGR